MNQHPITRREALRLGAKIATVAAFGSALSACQSATRITRRRVPIFNVRDYGAVGDGTTLDTAAIQRAIAEAAVAGGGVRVLIPGGRRYLIGTLQLKGGIDFHLADDAELLVSTKQEDNATGGAVLSAQEAHDLRISGNGTINGRSPEFVLRYDEQNEWWRPARFRPNLLMLTGCKNLEI